MELVMAVLLIGVRGILVLLIVAVWKDAARQQPETHPSQRGTEFP